jgi:hypothetical protein
MSRHHMRTLRDVLTTLAIQNRAAAATGDITRRDALARVWLDPTGDRPSSPQADGTRL